MGIAIFVSVHDGVVLAADSASVLTFPRAAGGECPGIIAKVYNNTNKITNLYKGKPIGCVAFGSGSIGSASISTLLKDFRRKITKDQDYFHAGSYSMEGVAKLLWEFLKTECCKLPESALKPSMGLFVGGYAADASLGEGWSISIEDGTVSAPEPLKKGGEVGINWGGEGGEAVSRLVWGYSQKITDQIDAELRKELEARMVFAPMPIQDAIDLAEFLVHVAIMYSRFQPGPPVVGGPIEVAAITKHEGFRWIRRAHYYTTELNREAR